MANNRVTLIVTILLILLTVNIPSQIGRGQTPPDLPGKHITSNLTRTVNNIFTIILNFLPMVIYQQVDLLPLIKHSDCMLFAI